MEKQVFLAAVITGEMSPARIPAAPGVDVEAIKQGDDDPMEVVVEVSAGKSTRGWNYRPESLNAIVQYVNKYTLSGFLGHQKAEDVATDFEPPVTHWIGAKIEGNRAYFRGVIDAAAKDLKRWIRSRRITQVSIFGFPKLQQVGNETNVVDYKPLSIDWTPLNRAGMTTRIVSVGEIGGNLKEEAILDIAQAIKVLKEKLDSGEMKIDYIITSLDKSAADSLATMEKIRKILSNTDDIKTLEEVEVLSKIKEKLIANNSENVGDKLNSALKALETKSVNGEMKIDLSRFSSNYSTKRVSI